MRRLIVGMLLVAGVALGDWGDVPTNATPPADFISGGGTPVPGTGGTSSASSTLVSTNRYDELWVNRYEAGQLGAQAAGFTAGLVYTGVVGAAVAWTGTVSGVQAGDQVQLGFRMISGYGTGTLTFAGHTLTGTAAATSYRIPYVRSDGSTTAVLRLTGVAGGYPTVSNVTVRLLTNGDAHVAGRLDVGREIVVDGYTIDRAAAARWDAVPSGGGDITSVTSATPGTVFIVGGDNGDVGVGVSNVTSAAQLTAATNALRLAQAAVDIALTQAVASAWALADVAAITQATNLVAGVGYLKAESDTLASVTARGATTAQDIHIDHGGLFPSKRLYFDSEDEEYGYLQKINAGGAAGYFYLYSSAGGIALESASGSVRIPSGLDIGATAADSGTDAGDSNLTVRGSMRFGVAGQQVSEFSTDGTMGGNSDTAVPTEQAVKTYAAPIAEPLSLHTNGDNAMAANINMGGNDVTNAFTVKSSAFEVGYGGIAPGGGATEVLITGGNLTGSSGLTLGTAVLPWANVYGNGAGLTNIPSTGLASANLQGWTEIPTNGGVGAGQLASGAALSNLGGGTGTTALRKDGTWGDPYVYVNSTNAATFQWWAASNRFAVVQVIGATTNVTFVSPAP